MSFSQNYLEQTSQIASSLDSEVIENIAEELSALRKRNGRLFYWFRRWCRSLQSCSL